MTDWWSNDPVASAPAGIKPWWEADPVAGQPAPVSAKTEPAKAPAPDLLKVKVRADLDKAYAAGLPKPGFGRQFAQGATLGFADEILAGFDTPVQMLLQGVGPGEAYRYAKAREDMMLADAQKDAPVGSILGQLLGGVVTGGKLYQAGATAIPAATARLGAIPGAIVGGAADGAALGAVSGFGDGRDGERLGDAAQGAIAGSVAGGGLPALMAFTKPVLAPIASNISARMNPAAYAERQVGRAAERSGMTADEIADRTAQAAAEGQGEYRLLDALGYPGARLGAVVGKNPGEGRTQLRDFLNQRQEGQGYRIGNALADGFDAPQTSQALSTQMTNARRAADDAAFGAVRREAGSVDVEPVVSLIDDTLRPTGHLTEPNQIAHDSVEAILARARRLLTDQGAVREGAEQSISDFTVAQRARADIADAVEAAQRQGRGNQARLLRQVRDALDTQLQGASPTFRDAMANSARAAREIEAIDTGRAAAGRGRSEDKIATFGTLTPGEQTAFRSGYVDPLIARAHGAAEGANKARPFTSLAMQTELPALAAPGRGDALMRRLSRENEMFANRNEVLGNSKTAENLADNADTGVDVGVLARLLGGDIRGAASHILNRGAAGLNGNTEAVRDSLARILLSGSPDEIRTLLGRLAQTAGERSNVGAGVFRGLLAGGLPTLNSRLAELRRLQPARQAGTGR